MKHYLIKLHSHEVINEIKTNKEYCKLPLLYIFLYDEMIYIQYVLKVNDCTL